MSTDLLTQLKDLRLYGMSDAWADIKAEAPQRQQALSPEILLRQLINAEITDRQARSLKYQLKVARFPIHRDLVNFKWDETPAFTSTNRTTGNSEIHGRCAQPHSLWVERGQAKHTLLRHWV